MTNFNNHTLKNIQIYASNNKHEIICITKILIFGVLYFFKIIYIETHVSNWNEIFYWKNSSDISLITKKSFRSTEMRSQVKDELLYLISTTFKWIETIKGFGLLYLAVNKTATLIDIRSIWCIIHIKNQCIVQSSNISDIKVSVAVFCRQVWHSLCS